MREEKLLTVRDVASILGASEKEVLDFVDRGTLTAYKIGGVYLRFRPEQIEEFKKHYKPLLAKQSQAQSINSVKDRAADFFYFNDFYIISAVIITILLIIILRG